MTYSIRCARLVQPLAKPENRRIFRPFHARDLILIVWIPPCRKSMR